jgi:hypothetical protein
MCGDFGGTLTEYSFDKPPFPNHVHLRNAATPFKSLVMKARSMMQNKQKCDRSKKTVYPSQ